MNEVPIERVERIAARGECHAGCTHRDCDAARLAHEVLSRIRRIPIPGEHELVDNETIGSFVDRHAKPGSVGARGSSLT